MWNVLLSMFKDKDLRTGHKVWGTEHMDSHALNAVSDDKRSGKNKRSENTKLYKRNL